MFVQSNPSDILGSYPRYTPLLAKVLLKLSTKPPHPFRYQNLNILPMCICAWKLNKIIQTPKPWFKGCSQMLKLSEDNLQYTELLMGGWRNSSVPISNVGSQNCNKGGTIVKVTRLLLDWFYHIFLDTFQKVKIKGFTTQTISQLFKLGSAVKWVPFQPQQEFLPFVWCQHTKYRNNSHYW